MVAWVDKNYNKKSFEYCRVQASESIVNQSFDFIIIANSDDITAKGIKDNMLRVGIPDNKTLWDKPEIGAFLLSNK